MATASRVLRHPVVPFVAIAAVVVVAVAWSSSRGDAVDAPKPLRVRATSMYEFSSLDEMSAASDLVVEAEVVAVERGRLVGDPGEGGVISRVVTLAVHHVFRGDAVVAATVIVEEEGWLADGTPIIVDDLEPSVVGDHGVWFLDALDDPDLPAYLVINSQGRMLERDDHVGGGDQTDPLVRTVQQQSFDELVRALDTMASTPPP